MNFKIIFYITLTLISVLVFVYQSPEIIEYSTTTDDKTETAPKAVAADDAMAEAEASAYRRLKAGPPSPRATKCSYQ